MLVYTSVTKSYIPKARVLARTLKRFHPHWTFCLVLSDIPPQDFELAREPFDLMYRLDELGLADWKAWAFGHSLVELCTAVKGPAAKLLAGHGETRKLMYLDPDIRVYASLEPLETLLNKHDILLTPHLLDRESQPEAVCDNEICALRHGTFNLGFFAARTDGQGREFIRWWNDRLLHHCIDDIPRGLFTDQRWCDLAPCFFDRLHIVRDRGYNVATWNVAHRPIAQTTEGKYFAGAVPLRFYHFTGYDSGDGIGMLRKYAPDQPAAFELWEAYGAELAAAGNGDPIFADWAYGRFSNGVPITLPMRRLYRNRADLKKTFPDPYDAQARHSYHGWLTAEARAGRLPFDMIEAPADSSANGARPAPFPKGLGLR